MATDICTYSTSCENEAIPVVNVRRLMEVIDEDFLSLSQPETEDDIRHIQMLGMYRALLMSVSKQFSEPQLLCAYPEAA